MSEHYAREHYQTSLALEKNETKLLQFGPAADGRILITVSVFLSPSPGMASMQRNAPAAGRSSAFSQSQLMVGNGDQNGGGIDVQPGNPNNVTYVIKRAGTVVREGQGNTDFEYTQSDNGSVFDDGRPWTMEVTNTGREKYYIQLNIYYTGIREILSKEVDLEALQAELDTYFDDPDYPIRMVLENRPVPHDIPGPYGPQTVLLPHTFAKLEMNPLTAALLQGEYGIDTEKDLGFELVNRDLASNPVKASVTTMDGHLALRIDIAFRPLDPVRFQYKKEGLFGIDLFEFEANLHRLAFSIFIVMQPRPGQGMMYSITRVDDFYAHPLKVELLYVDFDLPAFIVDLLGAFPNKLVQQHSNALFDYLSNKILDNPTWEYVGFDGKLFVKYAAPKPSVGNMELEMMSNTG